MEMEDGKLMYTTGRSYDNTVAMAGDHGVVQLQSGWTSLYPQQVADHNPLLVFNPRDSGTFVLSLCYLEGGYISLIAILQQQIYCEIYDRLCKWHQVGEAFSQTPAHRGLEGHQQKVKSQPTELRLATYNPVTRLMGIYRS